MKNLFHVKNLGILLVGATLITSCNLFKKKPEKSSNTGWTYNDPSGSGFRVSKEKEQKTGPGLVFVEGGTFTMGAVEEDVMVTGIIFQSVLPLLLSTWTKAKLPTFITVNISTG